MERSDVESGLPGIARDEVNSKMCQHKAAGHTSGVDWICFEKDIV